MFFKTVFSITIIAIFATIVPAATQSNKTSEPDRFGDIFVHPRDKHYLPGTAPSRAELFEFSEQSIDGRGTVGRWEYRKGNRTINREVWKDQSGRTRSSFKIGRKF